MEQFFADPSFVISLISIVIASIALVITYKNPQRSETIKSVKHARQSHFNKIKENCLEPLVNGITSVKESFQIPEMSIYSKQTLLDMKKDAESSFINLELHVSIINHAHGIEKPFDLMLYDDLGHHYPDIKKKIETTQKFLDENYPSYHKTRENLVLKLFDVLEKSINSDDNPNKISLAVSAALICILDYDRGQWPNLYNAISKQGALTIIQEIIKQPEISELGKPFKLVSENSISRLTDLRHSLQRIIKYEGELQGKCSYL